MICGRWEQKEQEAKVVVCYRGGGKIAGLGLGQWRKR